MRALLDLIAPPRCAICAETCAPREAACCNCRLAIAGSAPAPVPVPGIDSVWAAATYEGVPRRLVAALKFGGRLALAGAAARAIAGVIPPALAAGALVPVPPDPRRLRRRGFDPADLIAAALARESGLPCRRVLRRQPGARQVGRQRHERLADPPRIFLHSTAPPRVVLVDDVVTTGATLAAAAAALRRGGSAEVLAVAFARA